MGVPVTTVNHLGLHVNDIEKAIEFYKATMGWHHIAGPFECKNDGTEKWAFTNSIYAQEGNTWEGFKLAHMVDPAGVGIELLQFENSYDPPKTLEFKRRGVFHFSITVGDMDAFLENFVAHGGKVYSDKRYMPFSEKNQVGTVFVADPFGGIIEVKDRTYIHENRMF